MALGTSLLRAASSTPACRRMVVSFWVVGDRVGQAACCPIMCAGFQTVRVVELLVQGACLEVVPGLVLCVAAVAFGVPCGDGDGVACVSSGVSGEEW